MAWREIGRHYSPIDEALNLKICDLCGALNLVTDTECIVCRWRGHFERRPEVVRIAMEMNARWQSGSDMRPHDANWIAPEDRTGGLTARLTAFFRRLRLRLLPRRH